MSTTNPGDRQQSGPRGLVHVVIHAASSGSLSLAADPSGIFHPVILFLFGTKRIIDQPIISGLDISGLVGKILTAENFGGCQKYFCARSPSTHQRFTHGDSFSLLAKKE